MALKPLKIHINSNGGSVKDGLRFYNKCLKAEKEGRQVIVTCDSSNATAASFAKRKSLWP